MSDPIESCQSTKGETDGGRWRCFDLSSSCFARSLWLRVIFNWAALINANEHLLICEPCMSHTCEYWLIGSIGLMSEKKNVIAAVYEEACLVISVANASQCNSPEDSLKGPLTSNLQELSATVIMEWIIMLMKDVRRGLKLWQRASQRDGTASYWGVSNIPPIIACY